jgi:hypothetical protein
LGALAQCRAEGPDRSEASVRGTILLSGREIVPVYKVGKRSLVQCRGTNLIEARRLSRYVECLLRADAGIRVQVSEGFIMGAGFCKNHDEPINYTVRVRHSKDYLFFRHLTEIPAFLLTPPLIMASPEWE